MGNRPKHSRVRPEDAYSQALNGAAEFAESKSGSAIVNYDPMTERHDDPSMFDNEHGHGHHRGFPPLHPAF